MSSPSINPELFKEILKEALVESLHENRELFRDVFVEALGNVVLVEAISEGRNTDSVERSEIMDILEVER